jgi:hypothetical protein
MAAMAMVAVMMLAAVGVIAMSGVQAEDAEPTTTDGFAVIGLEGFVAADPRGGEDEQFLAAVEAAIGTTVVYIATLDDDVDQKIDYTNIRYFEALTDAVFEADGVEVVEKQIYVQPGAIENKNIVRGLSMFTSAEMTGSQISGGADTVVFLGTVAPADVMDAVEVLPTIEIQDVTEYIAEIAGLEMALAVKEKVIEEKDKTIGAKDSKIADLEKELEDAKKTTKGDDTVAWCVAALGIIAAGVLAGFTALAAIKAKKEGRRFL